MHQQHKKREPDTHFETGTLAHLTPGTEGRVLDGRRTPGFIEKFDSDSAMFIWRITDFEDKGKYWEIPAEQISNYQLRKGSTLLHAKEVAKIEKSIQKFSKKLDIKMPTSVYKATEERIEESITKTKDWFVEKSRFLQKDKKLTLTPKPETKIYTTT